MLTESGRRGCRGAPPEIDPLLKRPHMAMNFRCRSCQTVFQHHEAAPGATIRCPQCNAEYKRDLAREAPVEAPDVREPKLRSDGIAPTRKKRKKRKQAARPILLPILGGAGLVAVLVVGGLIWLIASRPRSSSEAVADAGNPAAPDRGAPAAPP